LQHRSGLGDIKNLPDFDNRWVFEPRSEAELVAAISSLPRPFEPGQRSEYNNSGHGLPSFILEEAGGQPYAKALQHRLVQPLALRDTRFDLRAGLKPREAASYRWAGQWTLVRATDPSVPLGPGPEAWGHGGTIDGISAALAYFPCTDTTTAWCGNGHQVPREEVVRLLRRAVFEPTTRLPSFAPVQATVDFAVDAGRPPPAKKCWPPTTAASTPTTCATWRAWPPCSASAWSPFTTKGGLSHYADNMRAFENIFKTNEPVRRDRVAGDQEVFPLGKFGAFHSGSHRSCLTTR
jgi:hypothetical protein